MCSHVAAGPAKEKQFKGKLNMKRNNQYFLDRFFYHLYKATTVLFIAMVILISSLLIIG